MSAVDPTAVIARVYPAIRRDRQAPVIADTFHPERGWQSWPRYRKHISPSWCRKLRAQGYTHVAVLVHGRRADFTLRELLSRQTA